MNKQRGSARWTEREDALICRLRRKGRDYDEIAVQLPRRTAVAVKRRVAHLIAKGRILSQRASWTTEEEELLRSLLSKDTPHAQIAEHLPHRTAAAVSQQIQQLRLAGRIDGRPVAPKPHRRWTHGEESLLVQLREEKRAKVADIAAQLQNRTPRAVAARVHELIASDELERAASSPQSRTPWSREEDELVAVLRDARESERHIAAVLGRSLPSVRSHVAQRKRKGQLSRGRVGSREGVS